MTTRQNAVKLLMTVVSALLASSVFAQPGGEPLTLDTQTGIHSGAGGTVLQTGPLTSHEMVQAPSLPAVPGSQDQIQPIIEVTPYIGVPQQGERSVGNPPRVLSSSQKRPRTTSSPSGVAPVAAAPIAVTPIVSATQATQPSHSADPHIVSGAVTAPRQ
jgi:hypothetical protein